MLAPCYLVHGGEPLQSDEFVAQIKAKASQDCAHTVFEINNQFAWGQLVGHYQNLDMFAQQTLLELRLHSDQLNKEATLVLEQLLQQQNSALHILIRAGKLKPQTLNSNWVKYIQTHGQIKVAKAIAPGNWPAWVKQRLQKSGFTPSLDAVAAMANSYEGNLPALVQCIAQLFDLLPSGELNLPQIQPFLYQNSHFSVFSLSNALQAGDKTRIFYVFQSLQNEAVDPILMLWAVTREIRNLLQIKYNLQSGQSLAHSAQQIGIWREDLPNIKNALDRFTVQSLEKLLQNCKTIDSMLKGITPGNAFEPLLAVCLHFSGNNTLTIDKEPIL